MKRKVTSSVVVLFSVMLATGCGNAIPDLSKQEQAMAVEYMAGAVIRHDRYYGSRLVELPPEEFEVEEELTENNKEDEIEDTQINVQETVGTDDVTVIDNSQVVENVSMEDFLKLDSVKITYAGYEADDSYPDQGGDDLYFAMNATEGNKLFVLKFLAENISGSDVNLDIAQSGVRFKISLDGVEKNAMTTMLLNDLPYYQGTIAPGESKELVMICEVPEGQIETISSIGVVMKSADNTATVLLQ